VRRADPPLIDILAPLWPRVVGQRIARCTRPVAFLSGTLTLACACPSWTAQLRLMSEEMRAEINSFLGGSVVKRLRVQHDRRLEEADSPATQEPSAGDFKTPRPSRPDGAAGLDPEISRVLERSFAKYFARSGRKVH
jgi:predicted nucleic acid-binding Zn ribbon protein